MTYPSYNAYNTSNYMRDLQNMREQIDRKMIDLQQAQNLLNPQQTPQINQTFQLSNPQQALNDFDGKYIENVEDVKNTLVFKNSIFLNKTMSTLWFKDTSGNIKTYTLNEVVEKDEKDIEIDKLKQEIEQMKTLLVSQTQPVEPVVQNNNTNTKKK